jgi:hypothetical protein
VVLARGHRASRSGSAQPAEDALMGPRAKLVGLARALRAADRGLARHLLRLRPEAPRPRNYGELLLPPAVVTAQPFTECRGHALHASATSRASGSWSRRIRASARACQRKLDDAAPGAARARAQRLARGAGVRGRRPAASRAPACSSRSRARARDHAEGRCPAAGAANDRAPHLPRRPPTAT